MTEPGAPLFPEEARRHRIHRGLLTQRQEHIFTWMAVIVVMLYVTAWIGAIAENYRLRDTPQFVGPGEHTEPIEPPPAPTEQITGVFFGPPAPPAEFLNQAVSDMFQKLRGESGELRYILELPGARVTNTVSAPAAPGIYQVADDISIVTLVPRSAKQNGRIGTYSLGTWPFERGGRPRTERYAAPSGFIKITPQNQNFQVSEHFQLKQFLTKDQFSVWPKYLLLDPRLIDKLELTIEELRREGVRVDHVHVMSGFRTPRYNSGGGNTSGRANLSRHMYGDASDVYVDNNRDGQPDDITGDRRVTVADAERFARAAERVEKNYRSLVGGIGVYVACCGHGPFTHIDVRGFRARWRGSGSG
ncbi:MAG TPA: hypothetical protein VKB93_24055 [Thermoanaerobaculia bacterium]|nr:hypothetical protein [Thermoanaerobaculia bacterium]